jgi:FMN-dependent NADH-azoreductase
MATLLYIQASPRERSKSTAVAKAFIDEYKRLNAEDKIITLDIFEADLPAFDGPAVQAKYTILHGQRHSEQERRVWKAIEEMIEQFKAADKYLLSVPMWNFGIPYRLKQYIDIIIQPGYTFGYDEQKGYQGMVTGKPLLAIYARGGEYAPGTEGEALDMQKKYIETAFGFMGFTDIESIIVEPTLAAGAEVAAQKVTEATEKAQELARRF